MQALLIFIATFITVAGLAFQSLNINSGRQAVAVATSFVVSLAYLAVYKWVPSAQGVWESAGYVVGGPCGVLVAMRLFKRDKSR